MRIAEKRSPEVDAATYARAILNILDDFGEERARQSDTQRALLNILEDNDADRTHLESTQRAILNVLDDVDVERKRVEGANVDLKVVNEAMRDFTAVAAHSLRSPLASIVGFSAVLEQKWSSLTEDDRRTATASISRQSRNLALLVDDILMLSNIEGGTLETRSAAILLEEAIRRCLKARGPAASDVSVSCAPDLTVLMDPHHLQRILDGCVSNALKYGQPPVRIRAVPVGSEVEVRVLDDGPGVAPEFIPRLFGKFGRADTVGTRAEKGTGLGLSIVRGLARANGGDASYEPNVPRGACFVLRLRAAESAV